MVGVYTWIYVASLPRTCASLRLGSSCVQPYHMRAASSGHTSRLGLPTCKGIGRCRKVPGVLGKGVHGSAGCAWRQVGTRWLGVWSCTGQCDIQGRVHARLHTRPARSKRTVSTRTHIPHACDDRHDTHSAESSPPAPAAPPAAAQAPAAAAPAAAAARLAWCSPTPPPCQLHGPTNTHTPYRVLMLIHSNCTTTHPHSTMVGQDTARRCA